jgi:transposase
MLDAETGELMERRLEHESGEARAFYAGLAGPMRVGIEATGHTRWFERVPAELGHGKKTGDRTFSNVRDHPPACPFRSELSPAAR